MIIFGILLALAAGYSIINFIDRKRNELEKLGISFLTGMGVVTVGMFLLELVNIPITLQSIYIWLGMCIIGFTSVYVRRFYRLNWGKAATSYRRRMTWEGLKSGNLLWGLFFLLVVFFVLTSAVKSVYWPPSAYDNITGYDLMAKVTAAEGTFDNSLFGEDGSPMKGTAKRLIYPPMVSGSFAFAYLHELTTSKIVTALYLVFFVFAFYSLLRQESTYLNSIIGTFFLVVTPQYYAYTSLSTTNIPFSFFTAIGFIYLYFWIKKYKRTDLLLAALFLGFSAWTRHEGIVFVLVGLLAVAIMGYRNSNGKSLLWYSILAFPLFLSWNLYISMNFTVSQTVFHLPPYVNMFRLQDIFQYLYDFLTSLELFGITIYALLLTLTANINNIKRDKSTAFLGISLAGLLLLTLLYYHIDYTRFGNFETVMDASYRRGLLCFIPLFWFYAVSNQRARQFGRWLNARLEYSR